MRVDEVDGDRLPLEQIVIEPDDLAVLRDERDVGKVVGSPGTAEGGPRGQQGCGGCECRNRRDPVPELCAHDVCSLPVHFSYWKSPIEAEAPVSAPVVVSKVKFKVTIAVRACMYPSAVFG